MQQIDSGNAGAAWNNRIVAQLSFIKKHLRYPLDRHTALPALLIAAMLPAIGIAIYLMLITKSTSHYNQPWLIPVLIAVMLAPAIVVARRYLQTLRFVAVPARRTTAENIFLLQQFYVKIISLLHVIHMRLKYFR